MISVIALVSHCIIEKYGTSMCPFKHFRSEAQKAFLDFSKQSTKHYLYLSIYIVKSKGPKRDEKFEFFECQHCIVSVGVATSRLFAFCSPVVKSSFHSQSRERGVQRSADNFEQATLYLQAGT